MKKLLVFLFSFISVFDLKAQEQVKILILHTNDLHSRLMGYAPESAYTPLSINDDKTLGGFARIATIIKSSGTMNNDITLVLDA